MGFYSRCTRTRLKTASDAGEGGEEVEEVEEVLEEEGADKTPQKNQNKNDDGSNEEVQQCPESSASCRLFLTKIKKKKKKQQQMLKICRWTCEG